MPDSPDAAALEARLHWIYASTSPDELRERYDEWAADYDADLTGMAWAAPQAGAERCAAHLATRGDVLDAGCGTGLVGVALRRAGVERVIGFDLSTAMLARAEQSGAYAELHQGSLLEPLPFADGRFAAAVSVGVFTHGHVGPAAFEGLARVVAPGGHVTMTFRDDAVEPLGYLAEAERLESTGVWSLVERTDPAPLILEGDVGADMRVWTWRVNQSGK
jgi:predicted TPR repeat methyltransferase